MWEATLIPRWRKHSKTNPKWLIVLLKKPRRRSKNSERLIFSDNKRPKPHRKSISKHWKKSNRPKWEEQILLKKRLRLQNSWELREVHPKILIPSKNDNLSHSSINESNIFSFICHDFIHIDTRRIWPNINKFQFNEDFISNCLFSIQNSIFLLLCCLFANYTPKIHKY